MNRIVKQQLILPTILVLAGIEKIYDDYGLSYSGVSSTVTRGAVLSGIKDQLSPLDLARNKNRKDRKIDQTFRNLISHKDLFKNDIATMSEDGRLRLTENGFKILFDYFNGRLEQSGVDKFPELETIKKSVYNQLNSRYFPVKNEYLQDLNESVRNLIKSKVEEKKTVSPKKTRVAKVEEQVVATKAEEQVVAKVDETVSEPKEVEEKSLDKKMKKRVVFRSI